MTIKITSPRGHHEAVADADVSEALFLKMTGKSSKRLSDEIKTKLPDNFKELEGLWKPGKLSYIAVSKNDEMIPVKEFDPAAENIVFISPVSGG